MIGLFAGIETYNWTLADFDTFATFCTQNGIQQAIVKIYEITQGEWYGSIGGPTAVVQQLEKHGLNVLPYGFFYGDDSNTEIGHIISYLNQFGQFCVNMEGSFNNNTKIQPYVVAGALLNHPGTLYCSTWANPVSQAWIKNIELLDPVIDVWMPECYSDSLVKDLYAQFPKVHGNIYPTFHIINTPYQDASIYQTFSLWEYQLAQQAVGAVQQYVQQNEGKTVSNYPTNNLGMIANYLPVSEFQPGHSEFECGAFAVALNQRATNYNVTNKNSIANLIKYAEDLYTLTTGSNDPSNTAGASIDDMHTMIKNTQSYAPPGLHWWDMNISPTTSQEYDIASIKAAVSHGYPVVATVSETSVYDLDLRTNPYWWGPTGNHILTYVGIAPDGNLLAVDPANVARGDGNLQLPKQVQAYPRRYDIARLDNQWATIIQQPWLPPIPSNEPTQWPAYTQPTPPPSKIDSIVVTYDENSKQLIFMNGVTAVYRIQL